MTGFEIETKCELDDGADLLSNIKGKDLHVGAHRAIEKMPPDRLTMRLERHSDGSRICQICSLPGDLVHLVGLQLAASTPDMLLGSDVRGMRSDNAPT